MIRFICQLSILLILLCCYCNKSFPVVEFNNIRVDKVIEGESQGFDMDLAANKDIFPKEDGIVIKNRTFQFNPNIKLLILSYYTVSGDHYNFSSFGFVEKTKYPILFDLNKDDTVKIISCIKDGLEFTRNGKPSILTKTDSIYFHKIEFDTFYIPKNNKREIWSKTTLFKITYRGLLNLSTMKYK
jgi:hypothetical protein